MKTLKILLIGGGGREHAMAEALVRSPRCSKVFVAPGNGGTAGHPKMENISTGVDDLEGLLTFAKSQAIDLTVVGPEAPLADGCVDLWQTHGLKCFGPTQKAARLESSKAFAKAAMLEWSIPTARGQSFTDFETALSYLNSVTWPVVLKASGLAAGKGVVLPESTDEAREVLASMMLEGRFGGAGAEVVIEERLVGEEVSLLAFCDGQHLAVMPPARDHKRLLDGDLGPNTGGMGAYAPTPRLPEDQTLAATETVLQPVLEGMARAGTPYTGILYAGLMLTEDGPRVLEFNCRLGDPEAQVLLPLLESDFVDIIEACVAGRLDTVDVRWSGGAAATVVQASEGYPGAYPKGRVITGLGSANALEGVRVFHAGTRIEGAELVTSGGRVLAVTGRGSDLAQALERAYSGAQCVTFEGAQMRSDVGHHLRH